jgi:hypothetical protein
VTVKIPEFLLTSISTLEAELKIESVVHQAANKKGAAGGVATTRIAELESEITKLEGQLERDDALRDAALPDLCLTSVARAEITKQLDAARAELDGLRQTASSAKAGMRALAVAAVDREPQFEAVALPFLKDTERYIGLLDAAQRREIYRLPLATYFPRWWAIASSLGLVGFMGQLMELKFLSPRGNVVFFQGQYHDPDSGEIHDLRVTWRKDPALVEISQALVELAALKRKIEAKISTRKEIRLRSAERERLAAQQRASANPRRRGTGMTVSNPPTPKPAPQAPHSSFTYSEGQR